MEFENPRRTSFALEGRLSAVDALRTGAFLCVVLCHFGGALGSGFATGSVARSVCDFLVEHGSLGTDTFFLLAAYLLCRSLRAGANWKDAIRRRFLKIYPGFLAMFTIYLLLMPLVPDLSKVPQDAAGTGIYLLANLLLLPGIFPIHPLVTVAWSLSYVAVGYVFIGGLFRLMARGAWTGRRRAFVWAAMTAAIWTTAEFGGFPHPRLLFFPLGALLAEGSPFIAEACARWRFTATLLSALGVLAMVAAKGVLVPAGITLVVAAAIGSSGFRSPAITGLLTDLGGLSYPVFLSHGLVLHFLRWVGPATETFTDFSALLLGTVSLVLVTAILFRTSLADPLQSMLVQSNFWYGTTARQGGI